MADVQVVDAVEQLAAAAVGLTTLALSEADVGTELTLQQWRILAVVARSGEARVGEAACGIGAGLPAASRLVRRLERRGLVTTARDERDRRATLVRPTEAGLRLWGDVAGRRRRRIAAAIDSLDEPLPEGFGRGLELVVGALGSDGTSPRPSTPPDRAGSAPPRP
jgi:DNA-binding MarR family transcriptional regulator